MVWESMASMEASRLLGAGEIEAVAGGVRIGIGVGMQEDEEETMATQTATAVSKVGLSDNTTCPFLTDLKTVKITGEQGVGENGFSL